MDKNINKIFCIPGNGGTSKIAINHNIDIKDFNKIDSARELDDICQNIERKTIACQKEINKNFKGKNIIDFQMHNISVLERHFQKWIKMSKKK